jgi:hypothetical protein
VRQEPASPHGTKLFQSSLPLHVRAGAFLNRGTSYEAEGDRERAIADYRSAVEIDDNQPGRDALARLGAGQ